MGGGDFERERGGGRPEVWEVMGNSEAKEEKERGKNEEVQKWRCFQETHT